MNNPNIIINTITEDHPDINITTFILSYIFNTLSNDLFWK